MCNSKKRKEDRKYGENKDRVKFYLHKCQKDTERGIIRPLTFLQQTGSVSADQQIKNKQVLKNIHPELKRHEWLNSVQLLQQQQH